MKKTIFGLSLFILFVFISSGQALPRFALQKGLKCISCHINPTGGAERNSYGTMMFGRNELPVPAHEPTTEFNSNLTDQLVLGADIRMQFLYNGDQKNHAFQAMQGGLYLTAYLNSHTSLFTKFDFTNLDFEAYGLFSFWSNKFILKAGSFLPAYGIRLDDHTSYTRGGNLGYLTGLPPRGLIFYPNYREVGIEGTAYLGKSITLNLAFTNGFKPALNASGTSVNNRPIPYNFIKKETMIARAEYFSKISSANFFCGGSYYNGLDHLQIFGGFVGANWDRFTLLSELDRAEMLPGLPKADVRLIQLDYLVSQGFYATLRYDYLDPVGSDPLTRYVIGAEYFPYSYIEIRPQYRLNRVPGSTNPSNMVQISDLVLQLHIWF